MDQSKDPKHLRTEKHVWIQAHQSEWFYIPVQLYILYATLLCLSCTESNVQSLTDVWVLDKIILRVLLGKGGKASICWKQFRPLEYQQLIKFSSQTNPPLLLISQYIASTPPPQKMNPLYYAIYFLAAIWSLIYRQPGTNGGVCHSWHAPCWTLASDLQEMGRRWEEHGTQCYLSRLLTSAIR